MVANGAQTHIGYEAQWVVFAVMAVAAVAFAIAGVTQPINKRLPYYVNVAIMTIAATAYFFMATDDSEPTAGERKVVYARYVDWALTTPLLLVDLILMTALPASQISMIIVADFGMIVLGIIGAFDSDPTKWYYFVVSSLLMIALLYAMAEAIWKVTYWKNPLYVYGYSALLIYLIVLWVCYPIVWALGTGAEVISTDIEIILMGVLDLLAKPIFAVGVVILHGIVSKKLEAVEEIVEEVA
eukprot:TRINITY_DN1155_c0_g1_i4.p2 TRINITY_DN1155_c0_g1~~TRINITY_DN1155_c0_g1_i4.p2  ORF type:complete len:241 (-),score=29.43 TRINITY_DN1155_c0_g1_i4:340-1062(-)